MSFSSLAFPSTQWTQRGRRHNGQESAPSLSHNEFAFVFYSNMNYTNSNPACLDLAFVSASLDNLSGCFLTDPLFKNVSGNWYLSDGSQGDFGEIPVTYNHSGSLAGLIYSCISEYCESPDPNLGGCGDWNPGQPQYYSITNQSILGGTSFDTGACSGINNAVNPDIGGVGVCSRYSTFYLGSKPDVTNFGGIFAGASIVLDSSWNNCLPLGGYPPITVSSTRYSGHVHYICKDI